MTKQEKDNSKPMQAKDRLANVSCGDDLERHRPTHAVDWQPVASGHFEGRNHSGHIAYYIANPQPGEWILDAVERNTILDGVTEEDVEEGWLNDDQIQALWGTTLEEAQDNEYRHIVAHCSGVDGRLKASEVGKLLYADSKFQKPIDWRASPPRLHGVGQTSNRYDAFAF